METYFSPAVADLRRHCHFGLLVVLYALAAVVAFNAKPAAAQIYTFTTNPQVIPGTQGITPGPGIDLSGWNYPDHELEFADLESINLTGATFVNSDLTNASFYHTTLTNTNYTDSNLTNAILNGAALTDANFTRAIVNGASFVADTSIGFTPGQIYSTTSYISGNLEGIVLENNNLAGWDFANQNLSNADFSDAKLANADLTGAIIEGASFTYTTPLGFTASQLYSTASYAEGNLAGMSFEDDDLTCWNFSGQNLTSANLSITTLTNTDLAGAIIGGANLISSNLTAGQLYSSASYTDRNLTGIALANDDLTGWNFSGQNLSDAYFKSAALTDANFVNANLTGTNFYSSDLTGADFANANLCASNTSFGNFADSDLRGATGWSPDSTTIVHDTIQPNGSIQGLALLTGETLVIRNNPIAITIQTSATFDPASTLQLLLDADWTSVIGFPGLTPSLAGTLDLEFDPAIDPTTLLGDTFQLFNWNGPLPANDQFTAVTTAPGYTFDLSNLYTSGLVTLTSVPEPTGLVLLGAGAVLALMRRRARQRS